MATPGVYSSYQLEKAQQKIRFPLEQPALLNTLTGQMAGEHNYDEESINNLFTKSTIKEILADLWTSMKDNLIKVGSISSAITMIIFLLHLTELIIDTIINAYLLQQLYGCGTHPLAAVSSSITHFFVVLSRN